MLTVKELKEILTAAPDDTPVVIHLESRGRGYEGYVGKYFTNSKNTPYDGNCLIDTLADSKHGVVVISDWLI